MNTWCKRCAAATSDVRKLRRENKTIMGALNIAIGALKLSVGYEPFRGSLEPSPCSEALQKLELIAERASNNQKD